MNIRNDDLCPCNPCTCANCNCGRPAAPEHNACGCGAQCDCGDACDCAQG